MSDDKWYFTTMPPGIKLYGTYCFIPLGMSHNYIIGWSIVRAPLVMSWPGFGGRVIERDGLREEKTNPGQDTTAECQKVTGDDDVADEDCESKDEKYAEGGDDVPPDRGAAFDCQRLMDGSKRRFAHFFIVEDGQPFGGASLLVRGEGYMVQFPLVMLDDAI